MRILTLSASLWIGCVLALPVSLRGGELVRAESRAEEAANVAWPTHAWRSKRIRTAAVSLVVDSLALAPPTYAVWLDTAIDERSTGRKTLGVLVSATIAQGLALPVGLGLLVNYHSDYLTPRHVNPRPGHRPRPQSLMIAGAGLLAVAMGSSVAYGLREPGRSERRIGVLGLAYTTATGLNLFALGAYRYRKMRHVFGENRMTQITPMIITGGEVPIFGLQAEVSLTAIGQD